LRLPGSGAEVQYLLPEMLLSFMNESRWLTNQRMTRELKVWLSYQTVARKSRHNQTTLSLTKVAMLRPGSSSERTISMKSSIIQLLDVR